MIVSNGDLGHGATVEDLGLEEEDGVRVANGREEESLGLDRGPGNDHLHCSVQPRATTVRDGMRTLSPGA